MNRWWAAGVGGLAVLAGVVWSQWPLDTHPLVVKWFGPPRSTMAELYAGDPATAQFDHSPFDALLTTHVKGVQVDYEGLVADRASLQIYVDALATAPFDQLDRDGKLALLINAYNAFTLALIVDHWPVASIKDIPAAERWDAERWVVGGRTVSLTQLEHDYLRAHFIEPRVHFAINCASVGCPPLSQEAYVPERLDDQLDAAARTMHEDERWLFLRQNSALSFNTVELSRIYLWYGDDFEQVAGSALAFAARYRPELAEGEWRVEWKSYDWSLNRTP